MIADTGPLVAAANRRDRGHGLAAAIVTELGRDLIVPLPVAVETDQLLRSRVNESAARKFLSALAQGQHEVAFLSAGVFKRAAEIDARFAGLGLADASIMAFAERHDLPVLTFDFEHFRAAPPAVGYWRLVVDETRYLEATR